MQTVKFARIRTIKHLRMWPNPTGFYIKTPTRGVFANTAKK